jgi:tetratricopeptide (TPR) repeat protein
LGFRKGRQYAITWCKKAENYSYVKALECYDEAIKRDPTFAKPWYEKGKIFARTPELPENWMWHDTISPYITGIKPPPYPEVGSQTASKYRETLKMFDKATELDPKSVNIWFAKGNFYWKHTNGERDAIQCLSNAIALDSKFEPAWFVKAQALGSLGKHEESLKCYDEAIALLPTDAKEKRYDEHGRYYFFDRWSGKADSLSNLGKHEEAIKCCDKALEMVGRDEGHHVFGQKGITLAKLGKHEESIKCYDEALKRMGYRSDDSLPEINLAKADALSELGEGVSDETSMVKCYSSAIRFYTDKLFDDKHQPVVDIDDWEEGARKLQEICSRAINGFEKYYHYDDEEV